MSFFFGGDEKGATIAPTAHGLGLVAAQDLKAQDIVFSETPVLSARLSDAFATPAFLARPDVSKIVTQNILPQTVEITLSGIAGGDAMTADALRWFKVNTSDRTIELTMEVTQEWQDTGSEIMGKVMDGLASRMANEYDQRTKPLNLMITTLDDTTVPKDSTGASDIYQAKAFLADMMSKLIAGQIIIPKSLTSRPTGMSPPVMYVILFICSCIVAIIVALFCEVLGQARSRLNTPVA